MAACQNMWGLITKFFLFGLLIWHCTGYYERFTLTRRASPTATSLNKCQLTTTDSARPSNLAHISLRAEAVPFRIFQQVPLQHFSGRSDQLGKNETEMLSWLFQGDSVAHHRETAFQNQHIKLRKMGQHPFPLVSHHHCIKTFAIEWEMWLKVGMHFTELKIKAVKTVKIYAAILFTF